MQSNAAPRVHRLFDGSHGGRRWRLLHFLLSVSCLSFGLRHHTHGGPTSSIPWFPSALFGFCRLPAFFVVSVFALTTHMAHMTHITLPNQDDDNGEWMQLLRPSEMREVMELDRARKEVERQIIHANQVCVHLGFYAHRGHGGVPLPAAAAVRKRSKKSSMHNLPNSRDGVLLCIPRYCSFRQVQKTSFFSFKALQNLDASPPTYVAAGFCLTTLAGCVHGQ